MDITHSLPLLEGIEQLEVHWIVECGGEGTLVAGHILRVPVEHLPHGIDPGRSRVLVPEALGDLWSGVHTNPVKPVRGDGVVYPAGQGGLDKAVGLVQVREVGQPTHLDLWRRMEEAHS